METFIFVLSAAGITLVVTVIFCKTVNFFFPPTEKGWEYIPDPKAPPASLPTQESVCEYTGGEHQPDERGDHCYMCGNALSQGVLRDK